ncbi:MAG: ATP-binding cassette domain-containing protein [Oscillospiraceae bacterium]
MIEVQNLSKHFGDKKAVDNISFKVNDGEILGFLGPNGAGKSTTMNILTGYISSTGGKALIDGIDILEKPIEAKSKIGYLPELPPLYLDMTVKEYLNFIYDLKKCKLPRNSHLKDICRLVKIENVYNRIIKNLSKGYKQRVGFAQALVGNPNVLILDEPTVGLDPNQIIEVRSLIKKLGRNHTVILSSHILSEVQAVCDKIVVINEGKIVANDTEEHLSQSLSGKGELEVVIDGEKEQVLQAVNSIEGVTSCSVYAQSEGIWKYKIESNKSEDIRRSVFEMAVENGWCILEMHTAELSLEDIFMRLTAGEHIDPIISEEKEGDN